MLLATLLIVPTRHKNTKRAKDSQTSAKQSLASPTKLVKKSTQKNLEFLSQKSRIPRYFF